MGIESQSVASLHARVQATLNGEERQRGQGSWSPVERYLDPVRHEKELRALRRLPQAVDAASRLESPGDWLAKSVHGVPVLLTRSKDGALRAFINVCRHRGAALVPEGECGQGRERFVCPYHSWTYGTDGRCIGRPHDRDFAHAPKAEAGLVELPCTERFGLVWVVASPLSGFDWGAYFGPFGREVEELGFTRASGVRNRRSFHQPSNWKLVFDANLETYHFAYAHRETIAYLFHDNVVIHDQAGDHHRVVLPKKSFNELDGPPERMEGYARAMNVIYFFFPSTILLWEGDHINGFSVSPVSAESSSVDAWLIVPEQHANSRSADYWKLNFDMFWKALDEDFELSASMQAGMASGANEALCFGANEFPCERFHQSVERIIGQPG
ncbi:MAG: aromatic ring-hydroxylating dioxygenase subunit alpha [Ectothiorhodospiraceae bacterium]|nr:aromatic ring-hydroxylating dioxygenase subunit alpha [Ectothiorhodospiraceae bacterium]